MKSNLYWLALASVVAMFFVVDPVVNTLDKWRLAHGCPTFCTTNENNAIALSKDIDRLNSNVQAIRQGGHGVSEDAAQSPQKR